MLKAARNRDVEAISVIQAHIEKGLEETLTAF
jgi:hypothetical protein